eukprot:2604049-Rhodomonas_salina.2
MAVSSCTGASKRVGGQPSGRARRPEGPSWDPRFMPPKCTPPLDRAHCTHTHTRQVPDSCQQEPCLGDARSACRCAAAAAAACMAMHAALRCALAFPRAGCSPHRAASCRRRARSVRRARGGGRGEKARRALVAAPPLR